MSLGHILYGTAYLDSGNLRFSARIAGERGQRVTIEITEGSPFSVTLNTSLSNDLLPIGVGSAIIVRPAAMTEAALIKALRADCEFNTILRVAIRENQSSQPIADGTAEAALIASTALGSPLGGLIQYLNSRIRVLGWSERELVAKDKAVGLLFPFEARPLRKGRLPGDVDLWIGKFQVGLAFQTKHTGEEANRRAFAEQNCLIDLFREHLYYATKSFTHPLLSGELHGDEETMEVFGFSNTLKDEAANTTLENARLRVVGSYAFVFEQPSSEICDLTSHDLDHFQIGLWVDPDTPGSGGLEELDQTLEVPAQ